MDGTLLYGVERDLHTFCAASHVELEWRHLWEQETRRMAVGEWR